MVHCTTLKHPTYVHIPQQNYFIKTDFAKFIFPHKNPVYVLVSLGHGDTTLYHHDPNGIWEFQGEIWT